MTYRKKLIEVALPLEAINVASAHEKSVPRKGHPATMHLWWARRPLAACRAVLFSSLIDDPSEYMPDEDSVHSERDRLFGIIEDLVKWENNNNEEVLEKAKLEIARSVARNLGVDMPVGKEAIHEFLATKAPPVLDPFAGGGSIPLEAQRLGLRAYASDLNPVAVLINKALIEIPPKFANMPPMHPPEETPISNKKGIKGEGTMPLWQKDWKGAQGLAEDVRYYGKWMRDEAFKRIGHLYPPVTITKEILAERADLKEQGLKAGDQLTVIAWLWARTVMCPNPACGAQTPLVHTFILSTKKGKEAWIESLIEGNTIAFKVRTGKGKPHEGTVNRNGATCICCDGPIPFEYIRLEGTKNRMGTKLMTVIAEGKKGRMYLSPIDEQEKVALTAIPSWQPETELPEKALGFRVQRYGMIRHSDLFTNRQLVGLTTLSGLIGEVHDLITETKSSNINSQREYADSAVLYLAFSLDKLADWSSTICSWINTIEGVRNTFARQAIPMVWDFIEINPFSNSVGNFVNHIDWVSSGLANLQSTTQESQVKQVDATNLHTAFPIKKVISTDPPYYDNIGYADLSDFFYIWLRSSVGKYYQDLFSTLLVPKKQELVATPFRFDGDRNKANDFFENGLRNVFSSINQSSESDYPVTIFYAFKQSESDEISNEDNMIDSRVSTGWETMLEGLLKSSFEITGTWPIRTEREARSVGIGTNALASSIVLVCRPRRKDAPSSSRREFLSALKKELAPALRELQQGSIAPVDLAQASIGPGMAVYSRYSSVLEADGKPMSVRTALTLINQALDEYLSEQEGEYDADTRWALSWYEQFGHNEAAFGVAETLSKAKNTSVNGLVEAGILEARGGKVHLLGRDELDHEWDPTEDKRPTAWEAVQHLIYALENEGEESAAGLLARLGSIAEPARDLAYRLYTVCERKGWAQDALGYNMLVVAWPRLKELAAKQKPMQENLL